MLEDKQSETVKDRGFLVYFLFYGLGTLVQLPNNFFTTATDYWMYKFRDVENGSYTTSENRTELQAAFVANYSIVSAASTIVFLALAYLVLRRFDSLKKIIVGLAGTVVVFIITVIFAAVDTDSWQYGYYITTLVFAVVLSGFGGPYLVSVYEVASKFPPNYLGPTLTGQSICGIVAALIQIISLAAAADSLSNGLIYFLIGTMIAFVTLLSFTAATRWSKFFKHYNNKAIEKKESNINAAYVLRVLNKIKFYLFSLIFIQGSTIAIHPGLTSLVVSVDEGNGSQWNDVFFVPVVTFLLYNISEYIGREVGPFIKQPRNVFIILGIGICRVAFIPLIMFCNAQPRSNLSVVFDEDYIYIIFIIIFGFTNGYLANLAVLFVSLSCDEQERSVAYSLLMIIMIVSMAACSFLSRVCIAAL